MATQYPLQSKAFTWPLSALLLLSRIPRSALHIRARVPAALFPTTVGDDKTIILHFKTSNKQAYNPHKYWAGGHLLFSLNTEITAASDAIYENSFERSAV